MKGSLTNPTFEHWITVHFIDKEFENIQPTFDCSKVKGGVTRFVSAQ